MGVANSYYLALDGKDVFSIRSGEHTQFPIPAGEHVVSVKCFGGWTPTWKENGKPFVGAERQASYFEVGPSMGCAKITQITPTEARKLLDSTQLIDSSKLSNREPETSRSSPVSAPKTLVAENPTDAQSGKEHRLTGDELRRHFSKLGTVNATAPSGTLLILSVKANGALRIKNSRTNGASAGTYRFSDTPGQVCFDMTNPGFRDLGVCYEIYRLEGPNERFALRSMTSQYVLTY